MVKIVEPPRPLCLPDDVDHHSDSESQSDSDAEIQFPIGGLQDEDESCERDWALSSGLTVMEARKLTQVIEFLFVPFSR
jgi:hypothetical protein